MKNYRVIITIEAEQDIEDLWEYIARNDSQKNAEYVLDQIEQIILSLDQNPQRGHYPDELARQGIKLYREVFFKPYRLIYEIIENKVVVHLCVDGRRDMISLLERRLLR